VFGHQRSRRAAGRGGSITAQQYSVGIDSLCVARLPGVRVVSRVAAVAAALFVVGSCSDGDPADVGSATLTTPTTSSTTGAVTAATSPATGSTVPATSPPADVATSDAATSTVRPDDPDSSPSLPRAENGDGPFAVEGTLLPTDAPSPDSTGVPAGVDLTPTSGPLVVDEDGAVLDGLDIDGSVEIRADDVTIRNTRITSADRYPVWVGEHPDGRSAERFVIEDSRIIGEQDCSTAIGVRNYTARRVHITGCEDGAKAAGSVLIEDSFIAELNLADGAHNDGIQVSEGTDVVIRHNTILAPFRGATSAILVIPSIGDIDEVEIVDNFLSGGTYSLYVYAHDDNALGRVQVRGNRFHVDSQEFGAIAQRDSNAEFSDNVQFDRRADVVTTSPVDG
jgi:hypothetical protein